MRSDTELSFCLSISEIAWHVRMLKPWQKKSGWDDESHPLIDSSCGTKSRGYPALSVPTTRTFPTAFLSIIESFFIGKRPGILSQVVILQFVGRNESQGCRVDTVPLACRCRSVIEYVAKM